MSPTIDFHYAPPISWVSVCQPDNSYKTMVGDDEAIPASTGWLLCGNTLELRRGLPPEWIKPGATIYLEPTPTRFGAVTLDRTRSDGVGVNIEIVFDANWPLKPEHCVLYLPNMSSITLDGTPESTLGFPVKVSVRVSGRIATSVKGG